MNIKELGRAIRWNDEETEARREKRRNKEWEKGKEFN